jgi:hypothetical protein
MHEVQCPGCGGFGPYRPRRYHDDGTEFECACGHRHTQREDGPGEAFCFFPGDIYRAFQPRPGALPALDIDWGTPEPKADGDAGP